jgi:hypothetical protein
LSFKDFIAQKTGQKETLSGASKTDIFSENITKNPRTEEEVKIPKVTPPPVKVEENTIPDWLKGAQENVESKNDVLNTPVEPVTQIPENPVEPYPVAEEVPQAQQVNEVPDWLK